MNTDELLKLHFEQDDRRFEAGEKRMNSIEGKLDVLIAAANKQKGFIAGVSAAFSLLATTIIGLVVYIWQTHFKG